MNYFAYTNHNVSRINLDLLTPHYKDLMEQLSPDEQPVVDGIAKTLICADTFNAQSLIESKEESLHRAFSRMTEAELAPILSQLEARGVLQQTEQGYSLINPGFALWYKGRYGKREEKQAVNMLEYRSVQEWNGPE